MREPVRRPMDDPTLERFSRLAAARPEYLASVFDRYTRYAAAPQPGGRRAGTLAEYLGVSPRDLRRLGLYLRPRPDHFEADVTRTATAFGIDRFRLAEVVRHVDVIDTMTGAGTTGT